MVDNFKVIDDYYNKGLEISSCFDEYGLHLKQPYHDIHFKNIVNHLFKKNNTPIII